MRIQYEPGDLVYTASHKGVEVGEVVKVHKLGVTVQDEYGQRFYLGKRQVEPLPNTVIKAKWIAS